MKNQKIIILILMIVQLILVAIGTYVFTQGYIYTGIFNIVVNAMLCILNVYTMKNLSDEDE